MLTWPVTLYNQLQTVQGHQHVCFVQHSITLQITKQTKAVVATMVKQPLSQMLLLTFASWSHQAIPAVLVFRTCAGQIWPGPTAGLRQ